MAIQVVTSQGNSPGNSNFNDASSHQIQNESISVDTSNGKDNPGIAPFTAEQEILFARRFNEEYNLYDADYARWLKKNHPDVN